MHDLPSRSAWSVGQTFFCHEARSSVRIEVMMQRFLKMRKDARLEVDETARDPD